MRCKKIKIRKNASKYYRDICATPSKSPPCSRNIFNSGAVQSRGSPRSIAMQMLNLRKIFFLQPCMQHFNAEMGQYDDSKRLPCIRKSIRRRTRTSIANDGARSENRESITRGAHVPHVGSLPKSMCRYSSLSQCGNTQESCASTRTR